MKKYIIANPTGNLTALITEYCDSSDYISEAALIMNANPEVEQAGFIIDIDGDGDADIVLQMAGGEFCGNATLSAAAYYLMNNDIDEGDIRVRVSGASAPLIVSIEKKDTVYYGSVAMPLPTEISVFEDHPIVIFDGITHMIVPSDSMSEEQAEACIRDYCKKAEAPAFGILLWDEKKEYMKPLVYVSEIDSLFWEHGCASGTSAIGAYYAYTTHSDVLIDVHQPGGTLRVSAGYELGSLTELKLSGSVSF